MAISNIKLVYITYAPAVVGVMASLYEGFNVINGKSDWVALVTLIILTGVLLVVGRFVQTLQKSEDVKSHHYNFPDSIKTKVSTTSLVPITDIAPEALPFLNHLLATSHHGNKYNSLQGLQTALDNNPAMQCNMIVTDSVNVGYVIYWDFSDFVFIEQIDITKPLRNTGIGTAALLQIIHDSFMPVVVEVIDNELTESNIKFLSTLGFSTIEHIYCRPSEKDDGSCIPAMIMVTEDLPNMKFETLKSIIHNHVHGTKA